MSDCRVEVSKFEWKTKEKHKEAGGESGQEKRGWADEDGEASQLAGKDDWQKPLPDCNV